jgi:hypothetical protein
MQQQEKLIPYAGECWHGGILNRVITLACSVCDAQRQIAARFGLDPSQVFNVAKHKNEAA